MYPDKFIKQYVNEYGEVIDNQDAVVGNKLARGVIEKDTPNRRSLHIYWMRIMLEKLNKEERDIIH